ncbi:MAG: hypothetical protein Q9216_004272 [Gyalolechia sp. 2 TL-2023]
MDALLSTSPVLDPNKAARIPISLGPGLTKDDEPAHRFASLQCKVTRPPEEMRNYKPRIHPENTTRIRSKRRPSDPRLNLVLKNPDERGEYHYEGSQQPSGSCALIYDPSTKSLTLEKLDVDFTFNLRSTPSNHDRSQVISQYPQLDASISDIESDDGSNVEAPAGNGIDPTDADANNPYDYRHFLKRRRTSSPEAVTSRPSLSPQAPPRRLPRTNTKPKPRPRPQQRPARPPQEEPQANTEDSDDGGLTIEMGDSPKPRRFGNGAVVFNHDRRNGPISLRSAASSMSPASIRHDSGNEEAESDNDVEHLELPSPEAISTRVGADEEDADEDDDDLVEDLMQAMESQEDEDEVEEEKADARANDHDQTIVRTIEESSSESEEE